MSITILHKLYYRNNKLFMLKDSYMNNNKDKNKDNFKDSYMNNNKINKM